MAKVEKNNITAVATIPEIRAGVYNISIDVRLPISDVSITDKDPYMVRTAVEKMRTVEMPVGIKYTGNSKTAFTSVQSRTEPEKMTLWGPESVLDTVGSLEVSVDVGSVSEDSSQTQKYRVLNKNGQDITNDVNIRKNADTVTVVSNVYRIKDAAIVPAYAGQLPQGYVLTGYSVSPSEVRLGSKGAAVDSIAEVRTQPIDLSGFTNNTKLTAALSLPGGVVSMSGIQSAEVTLMIEQTVTKAYSIGSVTFGNAENSLKYSVSGLPLEISVSGAASLLENAQVTAEVNVAGIGAGTHELPLIIKTPKGISAAGDYKVSVQVSQ